MNSLSLARLQERGQFTVPAKLRDAVGLKPGDTLLLRPLGPGRFEVVVLPHQPLSAFFEERTSGDVSLTHLRDDMGREITARHSADANAAVQEAAATRVG